MLWLSGIRCNIEANKFHYGMHKKLIGNISSKSVFIPFSSIDWYKAECCSEYNIMVQASLFISGSHWYNKLTPLNARSQNTHILTSLYFVLFKQRKKNRQNIHWLIEFRKSFHSTVDQIYCHKRPPPVWQRIIFLLFKIQQCDSHCALVGILPTKWYT